MDDSDENVGTENEDDPELSHATLDRMVREIRPEWSVREATPAEEGTDIVYFVTVETPEGARECVLKACEFLDPESFRPEPHLLALLDRRTVIPVPGVVGAVDYHDDLPAPFFLMERREGEVREGEAGDLPADALQRIARDAGRNLGRLHALGDFRRFGRLRLGADVTADRDAIAVGNRRLVVGDDATESWREAYERPIRGYFDDVEDRFADLVPDLRAFVDARLDALDRRFDPVIAHHDYRLGNLLVDAETGETRAVIDWGNMSTGDALADLVVAEQHLSGWLPPSANRRARVRAALREGYAETNDLERDGDFERRRDLYRVVSRTHALMWFSMWWGDTAGAERDRVAAMHRRAFRELLD